MPLLSFASSGPSHREDHVDVALPPIVKVTASVGELEHRLKVVALDLARLASVERRVMSMIP